MIGPGSKVYILPSCSLRFGGRWGHVRKILSASDLPIGVLFDGERVPYYFDENELVTEAFYNTHKNDKTSCYSCGSDTTGQFITTCEPCSSAIFEEEISNG